MNFQDLLNNYSYNTVDYGQFLINALLAVLLTWILTAYYRKYGKSVGNRSGFSNNFMLLALTTMLIIFIVKSSIALSLGLVGALSIVRFRAAIKEPEELTYLFLVIGIGLGMGAGQPGITVLAFTLIIALLYIRSRLSTGKKADLNNQMLLNINTSQIDEDTVADILKNNFKFVEIRRLSRNEKGLFMSFSVDLDDFNQLTSVKNALLQRAPDIEFSFVDVQNLAG